MANVDIQLGYKNAAFFAANPTLILEVGQIIYLEQTGTYKIGDGVSQLSVLSFLGTSASSELVVMYLNTIDSATITGTTVQTIMSSYSFNANDYLVGDVVQFYLRGRKIGTSGATTLRIYYNTANDLTGAVLIQSLAVSNTQLAFSSIKNGIIKSASVTEFYSQNTASDIGSNSTTAVHNINIDYTNVGYFIIALVNASAADSTTISLFEVQRKRL